MHYLLEKAAVNRDRIAIISNGTPYSYDELLQTSSNVAQTLLGDNKDLCEARIAFMVDPSFEYSAIQWGIWTAGGIAVPLCVLHPNESIKYVLEDAQVKKLIVSQNYKAQLSPLVKELGLDLIVYESIKQMEFAGFPTIDEERSAMILYTSGTTSKPKGVVTTHKNTKFQIITLVEAWAWHQEDHILNILPLHHVHGIINVMSCALYAGAICEFLPKFDAKRVWQKFSEGQLSLFMAVPTIYYKLIKYWKEQSAEKQKQMSNACRSFRLMVSGSAALPVPVLHEWKEISGQILLERYGMTEIGMALSNPYVGERRPGHVGQPLPGVSIRLANEQDKLVAPSEQGEIQIKGPNVFKAYWNKEEATTKAFTSDGWFKSGDIAILNNSYYQILGRNSVDIIKSGGYKISALEIESVMLKHKAIEQVGVVGVQDEEWGEVVCAALVCTEGTPVTGEEMKSWLSDKLPSYKVPRRYIHLDDLPKNTLGKVTKNKLKNRFS